jgi:predicted ATP-grasp superfamily ATP-dependent carboligase
VEEAGGRLLGPSAAAVRLTGDKLLLARHLIRRGVPTPPVLAEPRFPAVWKPRHGAGSQATFLVRSPEELMTCAARARAEGWEGEAIVQPFVPGLAASVALLLGPRQQVALRPGAQSLSADGRFHYQGGTLQLAPALAERVCRLAWQAVRAVAGLQGYVGVDVVLGEAADGSRDRVIEINPRLTTSYVGLRALAESNLAEAMLGIVCGKDVPGLRWRAGVVRFQADGTIRPG